jgi:hypothetical protein
MGWWKLNGNEDVIGDEVMDLIRHFIKKFSQAYQDDLSRKPTIDELQYALNLGLKINANDDVLAGFSEREICQIIIKTQKRPKRQKPKTGDFFYFKISANEFGFGRVISNIFVGLVVEIFKTTSKWPILETIKIEDSSFTPIIVDGYSLFELQSEGEWRILKNDPSYMPSDSLKKQLFVFGDTPDNLKCVDIFNNRKPISPENAQGLPSCVVYGNSHVIKLFHNP